MVFQVVGVLLADVAKVADAKGDASQTEVERQQLAKAKGITGMSTEKIVPHPTLGYFVIALAEIGTEHHAYHRQVCLIAHPDGKLLDAKRVAGSCRERDIGFIVAPRWHVCLTGQ